MIPNPFIFYHSLSSLLNLYLRLHLSCLKLSNSFTFSSLFPFFLFLFLFLLPFQFLQQSKFLKMKKSTFFQQTISSSVFSQRRRCKRSFLSLDDFFIFQKLSRFLRYLQIIPIAKRTSLRSIILLSGCGISFFLLKISILRPFKKGLYFYLE